MDKITQRGRVLLASTIGFVVLYLAALLALGTPPEAKDDGATVAAWFRDHGSNVRWWMWLSTLALPLFALFAILIRERLPRPHSEVFLYGAIAFGASTAVQAWLWGALAWHAQALEPATARTLFDVASYWGPVLTATTVLMLAPIAILGIRGLAGIPRWLGIVSGVALAEQLVETITIFGQSGFLAPGGPMNLFVGAAAVLIAWVALGVSSARSVNVPA
jgi:hypothetical protein